MDQCREENKADVSDIPTIHRVRNVHAREVMGVTYFADWKAAMAVMTARSKYLSRNLACLASVNSTCRTLKAWILVSSDVCQLISASLSKLVFALSVHSGSPVTIARMEYGSAAERRVVERSPLVTTASSAYRGTISRVTHALERDAYSVTLTSSQFNGRDASDGTFLTDCTRSAKEIASFENVPR